MKKRMKTKQKTLYTIRRIRRKEWDEEPNLEGEIFIGSGKYSTNTNDVVEAWAWEEPKNHERKILRLRKVSMDKK